MEILDLNENLSLLLPLRDERIKPTDQIYFHIKHFLNFHPWYLFFFFLFIWHCSDIVFHYTYWYWQMSLWIFGYYTELFWHFKDGENDIKTNNDFICNFILCIFFLRVCLSYQISVFITFYLICTSSTCSIFPYILCFILDSISYCFTPTYMIGG